MSEIRILAIIPARAGSKGVPHKNTRCLAGKSLIERAFEVAQSSKLFEKIILSSDDHNAIGIAQKIGLEVPFVRPSLLATDVTPMIDVVLHSLDFLDPDGEQFQAIMLLQPTSPFRKVEHLNEAVRLLQCCSASGVCSVVPVPFDWCPHYLLKLGEKGMLAPFMPDGFNYSRRQDVPRAYRRCGTVFLTRAETIRGEKSFYGDRCVPLLTDPSESLNIDSQADWEKAKVRLGVRRREEARNVV
ncbi:MAG: acylneuraminate cytidylyltransferase family protein [Myxococcales bacterium]|nr:acylneuraminate cytidylyltransferase family protein [Myxococcales bacterium]